MIFSRDLDSELQCWKKDADRKPLVLRGARQVGKTFAVRQLAGGFDHLIELNLERPRERELFSGWNSGRELVERIGLYRGHEIIPGRDLLFIDEIQHSPEAVRSLRYLHEDTTGLHVIAAGSLLEVFSNREGFSFPVGRVRNLFLFPVTFGEYLRAKNSVLAGHLFSLDPFAASPNHDLLLEAFNTYAFVGGMPEALAAFAESGSYAAARKIHDDIFMGYIEDVEKYSNLAAAKYLTHVIDRAPLYAGQRITYEKFGESAFRSREMKTAFDVLEQALIVYRARPSVSTRLPVVEKLRKAPRLYFLDTGLVNFRAGLTTFFEQQSLDRVYQGKIAEQVTAQEIAARSFQAPSLQFWIRETGAAETDFIYVFKDMVIPIEVKSGKTGRLKSLNLFMEASPHPYALRVYAGPPRVDTVTTDAGKTYYLGSIPYYFLSRLDDVLEWITAGKIQT